MKKRVLIIGGSGFIGTHVAQALKEKGHAVHTASRAAAPVSHAHVVDLADRDAVLLLMQELAPQWVFHLAGIVARDVDGATYQKLVATNVGGTISALQASREVEVEAFVTVGSFEEYGDAPTPFREDAIRPSSPYGVTKAMASLMAASYGKQLLPAAVLRFPVVYGLGMRDATLIGTLRYAAQSRSMPAVSGGSQMREFLHVEDAARALIRTAERIDSCRGEIINICEGKDYSVRDVIVLAERLTGIRPLVSLGALPERAAEQIRYVGSAEKARQLLDFNISIPFEKGLGNMLLA